jgi:hypothetical protein
MKASSLRGVTAVYLCSKESNIVQYRAKHPLFRTFYYKVVQLERDLGDSAQHEYWRTFLRNIKLHRFDLCAAPLPLQWNSARVATAAREHLHNSGLIYPESRQLAMEVVDLITEMAGVDANPLLEQVKHLILEASGPQVTWLVKEPRLVAPTEEVLTRQFPDRKIEVITAHQLVDADCFKVLFVSGPLRWFPPHVVTAPRTTNFYAVSFEWTTGTWNSPEAFALPTAGAASRSIQVEGVSTDEEEEPEEPLPEMDWEAVAATFGNYGSLRPYQGGDEEIIEVRLLALAGGHAVFLPLSGSVMAVNLEDVEEAIDREDEGDDTIDVSKVQARHITPGAFILLRTSGSGDYLVPVANRILGEQATRVREQQKTWKDGLRHSKKVRGLRRTIRLLEANGSRKANEINVQNWMSVDSIRPNHFEDFLAIMRLIGMEAEAQQFWHDAGLIRRAHVRAGHHIRRLLMQEVLAASRKHLYERGMVGFELAEADGGSLTAFRIESIDPGTRQVPVHQTGYPLKMETYHWLE